MPPWLGGLAPKEKSWRFIVHSKQFTINANPAAMVVHVPFYNNKLTHMQENQVVHTYDLIEAKISMEMRE